MVTGSIPNTRLTWMGAKMFALYCIVCALGDWRLQVGTQLVRVAVIAHRTKIPPPGSAHISTIVAGRLGATTSSVMTSCSYFPIPNRQSDRVSINRSHIPPDSFAALGYRTKQTELFRCAAYSCLDKVTIQIYKYSEVIFTQGYILSACFALRCRR